MAAQSKLNHQNHQSRFEGGSVAKSPDSMDKIAALTPSMADQGGPPTQHNLGVFHEQEQGRLEKDERDAARLYQVAADMGLEIDTSIEQTTIRVSQNEEFELQIPIRKNSWESHHSVTNPGQGASTLSKEICEHLHLCSQPRTYDLFDESGLRASISFRFGEGMHTYQNFIYMRKDLLDKYILETGKDLLWIIWGEKSVTNKDINPGYQVFQQISRYPRTQ
jgi:hypothetical protein